MEISINIWWQLQCVFTYLVWGRASHMFVFYDTACELTYINANIEHVVVITNLLQVRVITSHFLQYSFSPPPVPGGFYVSVCQWPQPSHVWKTQGKQPYLEKYRCYFHFLPVLPVWLNGCLCALLATSSLHRCSELCSSEGVFLQRREGREEAPGRSSNEIFPGFWWSASSAAIALEAWLHWALARDQGELSSAA